MAIGVTFTASGVSPEQAEQMAQHLFSKLKEQQGFLVQIVGPVDGGYRITEVWESRDDHTRWVDEHVLPML